MKEKVGIMLVLIGIACGDSPNLLIPTALIALGGWLLKDVIFGAG